jgi:hypothetical protein
MEVNMSRTDAYLKVILTTIAVCLIKLAFFAPPPDSFAQLPFLSSPEKAIDVNLKSIDDQEFFLSKDGDLHLGGKKGPRVFENGAWVVRVNKGLTK